MAEAVHSVHPFSVIFFINFLSSIESERALALTSVKSCSNILLTCRVVKISFVWVLRAKCHIFLLAKLNFTGDDTIDSYTVIIPSSIRCSHTNYLPTKGSSLSMRIIIVSLDDPSWLNRTCTVNSNQQTDEEVVIVRYKVASNSLVVRPLACCFGPRYLTPLSRNDVSCVGLGKGDLCTLVDSTYHKGVNIPVCGASFRDNCGKLQVNFRTSMPTSRRAVSLMKQASDWSSSNAYAIILQFGLS